MGNISLEQQLMAGLITFSFTVIALCIGGLVTYLVWRRKRLEVQAEESVKGSDCKTLRDDCREEVDEAITGLGVQFAEGLHRAEQGLTESVARIENGIKDELHFIRSEHRKEMGEIRTNFGAEIGSVRRLFTDHIEKAHAKISSE